ncbi:hypothetical protein K469DRAFT_717455 [Zopfia rhizophila CBS 207.26]|uniref:Uncharacterized protein n=1 Tax=Zopfia rhizophila CBS 207.26 TaxID=1314779 RepID=A0A6A6DI17_9PEZI|nr:hypothetical protein K469DRAFT_717455 [Zopfia rhizophila CBS 207.26]
MPETDDSSALYLSALLMILFVLSLLVLKERFGPACSLPCLVFSPHSTHVNQIESI